MAFETPTNPKAAKVEAAEKRRLAANLLAEAESLDPSPVKKPAKKPAKKPEPKKKAGKK